MKTVLVTGGTGSIGEAIATAFAENNNVVIGYNASEKKAVEIAERLNITAIRADVTDRQQVSDMVRQINEKYGGADVLINNAGTSQIKLFSDITPHEWHNMLNVHLDGAFNVTQEVLPYMINKKQGCIINISSIWGRIGASCEVHYSTAKAGLIGFTKALAKEVGLSGVRVNCIAPGVIESGMNKFDDDILAELRAKSSLNRIGEPSDVAQLAVFIESAKFITGQVISIDGGFV